MKTQRAGFTQQCFSDLGSKSGLQDSLFSNQEKHKLIKIFIIFKKNFWGWEWKDGEQAEYLTSLHTFFCAWQSCKANLI